MDQKAITESNGLAMKIDKCAANSEILGGDYETTILDLPPELLVKLFSLVGSTTFNPAPPHFIRYLESKSFNDLHEKCRNGPITERDVDQPQTAPRERIDWREKTKSEYSIRNLMMLRGVCSTFEGVINNEMVPGMDFNFLMIDVRLQGNRVGAAKEQGMSMAFEAVDNYHSRQVSFFKYGGNGSVKPCIHLSRVRRFNEIDFEHIQRFERIRDLHISDMVLTEELFETILRLDLTMARRIIFERMIDVKFDESIDIVEYIQNFLNVLNTQARVYFNSEVFDQNLVLFGRESEPVTDPIALRDIKAVEDMNEGRRSYHRQMLFNLKPQEKDFEFRRHKAINIINTILFNKPHAKRGNSEEFSYASKSGFNKFKMDLIYAYRAQMQFHGDVVQKAGKWHLDQALKILNKKNGRHPKAVMFHLKMLKKIVESKQGITAEEQEAIARPMNETKQRKNVVEERKVFKKFRLDSRHYFVPRGY